MSEYKLKLIMPMAGLGSRFLDVTPIPKPLIDVAGRPMFVRAVESIQLEFTDMIFLVAREHDIVAQVLEYYPDATVIEIPELTDGTASTLQYAREHWQDGSSIFISNCDQLIDYNPTDFYNIMNSDVDGAIAVFPCPERDPKWSYALCDSVMQVTRVAEKDPISDWATVGWYYFKDGRAFETAVDRMKQADDRVNGEFYTCPSYNYLLDAHIQAWPVDRMQGIGTPEDLNEFHSTQGQFNWPGQSR